MNVTLYGANGRIGSRILNELVSRGHKVKAVVRDVSKVTAAPGVTIEQGDMSSASAMAEKAKGSDAIISAHGAKPDNPKEAIEVMKRLVDAVRQSGVPRLMAVGGASSLEVAPGKQLFDEPNFPPEWKAGADAHREAKKVLMASDINWTYLSPAMMITPGDRTGKFRLGKDSLVTDAEGKSQISMEDYAVAMVDELESPKHERMRFTLAY